MLLRSVARWLGRGSPLHGYRAAPLSTERGREAHLDSVKLTMPSEDLARAYKPHIETCIAAFGPDRGMFESNFPPDGVR